jgi:integration host factor subunit beta
VSVLYLKTNTRDLNRRDKYMIKTDLIARVALKTKLSQKQTTLVVNTFLSSITDSLSEGNEVEIRGFGSFRIRQRNSRIGLNPKTGRKVFIPAKKAPYFRPGKSLKIAVNKTMEINHSNRIFTLQDLTQIV